jgi:bisphosphoglycerate-dependent phosphoglycerate mutase
MKLTEDGKKEAVKILTSAIKNIFNVCETYEEVYSTACLITAIKDEEFLQQSLKLPDEEKLNIRNY